MAVSEPESGAARVSDGAAAQGREDEPDGLNPRQRLFVQEYLKDLNATAAYQRAGYTARGNSAEAAASRLLGTPKVAAAMEAAMAQRVERVKIDADYVLTVIQETIERCRQAVPVLEYDKSEKRWVPTGEYKYDSTAVLRGAELLGKHLRLFTDKTELSGADGRAVEMVLNIGFKNPERS